MKKQFLWIAITILSLNGCKESCEFPIELESVKEEVHFERLEKDLFFISSLEDILQFLNDHEYVKREFLGSAQYPNDTILASNLLRRIQNPFIDTLRQEVEAEFGLTRRTRDLQSRHVSSHDSAHTARCRRAQR